MLGWGWGGTGLEQERGEEWVKGGVKGALDIFFSLSIIAAVMVWYICFKNPPPPPPNFV